MEGLPESSPPSASRHQSPTRCEKTSLSLFASRRTIAFAYAFTFTFVSCTVFVVFTSSSHSSPCLNRFFGSRSHFSSIFSYIFPNSSSSSSSSFPLFDKNQIFSGSNVSLHSPSFSFVQESQNKSRNDYTLPISPAIEASNGSLKVNATNQPASASMSDHEVLEKPYDAALALKESGGDDLFAKGRNADLLGLMINCNVFDGSWVKDDSYPIYAPGSCPQVDEAFNCFLNNRPDSGYEKYRWQPNHCNIPRLNGGDMLKLLRGKRLVFVGDSLNRNMWESLVCILRNSMEDKSRAFEASGRHEFRTEGSYAYVFKDYNCSIEFFRSPFLVQEWERVDTEGFKQTLRLDVIERSAYKYRSADILVFNTGHWWTHEKTSKGKGYYQEGSHIYGQLNVKEAFRKALTTWARWVDANVNARKTLVFFRGYSVSHFRGGRWNSGGQCDGETEPITNEAYLAPYPSKMRIFESVMKGMKTSVFYLNITRLTDFRKDAHPSIYRKPNLTEEERRSSSRYQDCSHWCLPGIPDTWNELLYAQLLIEHNQKLQQQNQE